jgi:Domain of unknown function (DUF4397)
MLLRKSFGFDGSLIFSIPAMGASIIAMSAMVAGCGDDDDSPDDNGIARVRVAHLSPDAPAVDFCLAAAGSGQFTGPILAGAGGAAGLSYSKVTKYLDVAAQRYDVRLVAPGSANCATSLAGLPDYTNLPALGPDATVTIAATGKLAGGEPFGLRAYIDEAVVTAASAKLRFIHASPGTPKVDVGLGGGVAFTSVFSGVSFGGIQEAQQGYITTPALTAVEISARATGTIADVLAIKPASLPAGAIATAFAIGEISNAQAPLRVLLCNDNAAPVGLESACAVVGAAPERARIRVAHLSPDAPAVDVCVAPAGSGAFTGPLLKSLGATTGLAYSQITEYVPLPVASFDVRVVLATATSCATAAVPDTNNIALAKDLIATVAAIGVLDRSGPAAGNPAFRLAVLVDSLTVPTGKVKLRFVHASPGTPAVDVGLLANQQFTRLFANVAFGTIGSNAGLDTLGYLETNPLTATVSARLAGGAADALVVPGVTLPAGAIATAFAIGGKTGATMNPLRVLLCTDSARTGTLLSQCAVAP